MKDKKMSIRISGGQLAMIHQKAAKAGLSLTDYVTRCCLGKQIVVVDGLDGILRELKAIGRNLNRLTLLCNMSRVEIAGLDEIKKQYAVMNERLSELLERKR